MSTLMIIVFLFSAVISVGAIVAVYIYLTKGASDSLVGERTELIQEIHDLSTRVEETLTRAANYCSQGQFESVSNQLTTLRSDLEREKATLAELDKQLDTAQATVEHKEAHQQDLKSSKQEDELKLEELLMNYSEISSESITLEQKLAQSMKNLDSLAEEIELTADQRAVVDELASSLEKAGESLRILLVEYETVNERLNLLREQHEDLEEEYTKLVEQQLGE